ncbi:MAG: trypsin-like serine protease [Pseudobacteriovorax sp.]|nr:trypsin-like serine protease [Pseudobacteriovorax sp.]
MNSAKYLILLSIISSSCHNYLDTSDPSVFGGRTPENPSIRQSSIGLFSQDEFYQGDWYADIEGSATLIAPTVAVGAAHTCLQFSPRYAILGPSTLLANKSWVRINRCVPHDLYRGDLGDEEGYRSQKSYDMALFFLDQPIPGSSPASITSFEGSLVDTSIVIAGFGSYENQFDLTYDEEFQEWISFRPFSLRSVSTFATEEWTSAQHFKDGPNPGKGSRQGDSGGSVYIKSGDDQSYQLLGMPLSGPACDEGIGYNLDIRYYKDWIFRQL